MSMLMLDDNYLAFPTGAINKIRGVLRVSVWGGDSSPKIVQNLTPSKFPPPPPSNSVEIIFLSKLEFAVCFSLRLFHMHMIKFSMLLPHRQYRCGTVVWIFPNWRVVSNRSYIHNCYTGSDAFWSQICLYQAIEETAFISSITHKSTLWLA